MSKQRKPKEEASRSKAGRFCNICRKQLTVVNSRPGDKLCGFCTELQRSTTGFYERRDLRAKP